MKTLTATLIAFTCLVCLAFTSKPLPIKIIDAYRKPWVSGADGRTGTYYRIKIWVRGKSNVEFTDLWLNEEKVNFNIELYSDTSTKKVFTQGDTLLLAYNYLNNAPPESDKLSKPPFKYNGRALIGAKVNGVQRYFIVSSFREEKKLMGK